MRINPDIEQMTLPSAEVKLPLSINPLNKIIIEVGRAATKGKSVSKPIRIVPTPLHKEIAVMTPKTSYPTATTDYLQLASNTYTIQTL